MKKTHAREIPPQAPDCTVCIHRDGCERYRENSFCTKFNSRNPEIRVPDPNEQWKKGEDAEFE